MKKRTPWLLLLLLLIAAGVGGYLYWNSRQPQADALEVLRTGEVTQGDLALRVATSGNVVPAEKSALQLQSSGRVTTVAVSAGDHVEAGEALLTLDARQLERAVEQAELSLEQARLSLQQLQEPVDAADVELAKVSAQNAAQALEVARLGQQVAQVDANALKLQAQRAREQAYRELQQAQEAGGDTTRALEAFRNAEEQEAIAATNAQLVLERAAQTTTSALLQHEQAQQALNAVSESPTPESIRLAEIAVEQAALGLDQAKVALEKVTLLAPFAGTVALVDTRPGAFASAGAAVVILVDDSSFYVDVNIDEIDVASVAVGQSATVTLDAYEDVPLSGVVDSVAPAATNIAGAIIYPLRIRLAGSEGVAIRDGLTASVEITVGIRSGLVLVPNWAVATDQATGDTYCYVVRNGTPVRTPISIGESNDSVTEVLEGVSVGDTVALVLTERSSGSLLERMRGQMQEMRSEGR